MRSAGFLGQYVKDALFAPLRLTVLSDEQAATLGLTSINEERVRFVGGFCRGRLLDIGCGKNELVRRYPGFGVGVDVFDWRRGALILRDTARLPFSKASFDTVSIIAALNHIPNRQAVLREATRVLRSEGQLILTMINPVLSVLGHRVFWWYGEDWARGMESGEVYGFWKSDIVEMLDACGMRLVEHRRFVYGLNHLYIFRRAG